MPLVFNRSTPPLWIPFQIFPGPRESVRESFCLNMRKEERCSRLTGVGIYITWRFCSIIRCDVLHSCIAQGTYVIIDYCLSVFCRSLLLKTQRVVSMYLDNCVIVCPNQDSSTMSNICARVTVLISAFSCTLFHQ